MVASEIRRLLKYKLVKIIVKDIKPQKYEKHHSFGDFKSRQDSVVDYQSIRARRVLGDWADQKLKSNHSISNETNYKKVLKSVALDLVEDKQDALFKITPFIAEEMATYTDVELIRFLYHRYRYDVFPQLRKLDAYPPYLQIEPSALCNFRCVFCYQTDTDFFNRSNPAMGQMSLDLFKQFVDQASGHIEFLSLASRGEPTICRDFDKMLRYSEGHFLNLKVNTNASLLTEKTIHALLCGGVRTVVFSADAAEEPLYSQLRVNGKLEKVLKNIERFSEIRAKEYQDLNIITRVSGVKVSENQDMEAMKRVWGGLVDQVAFVNYNPWENIYEVEPNGITSPCSDLWRRMFVWHDGIVNPCDTDYRSTLQVGNASISISDNWLSEKYSALREAHNSNARQIVEPCKRCSVV